jgi:GNAT superfamily N-acetyltransferase
VTSGISAFPRPAEPSAPFVRPAVPTDAAAIRDVAVSAWWATYTGRIGAESIERFMSAAYSLERVGLRIERHDVLVASDGSEGRPVDAFAEVTLHDDHVQVLAIYTRPGARGRGMGTALLARIREQYSGWDLAADVLVDNELAEPFYAARGFTPGELLTDEIAGEEIRERRWWLRAPTGEG